MRRYRTFAIALSLCLVLALTAAAVLPQLAMAADDFPTRPIRMVVPFGPGGSSDRAGRGHATFWTRYLGVPIVVENYAGAGTRIGHEVFLNMSEARECYAVISSSQPFTSNTIHVLGAPYTVDDFAVMNTHWEDVLALPVPGNSPYKTLEEFFDAVLANPGRLVFGDLPGGFPTVQSEILFSALARHAGINRPLIRTVGFDSGGEARAALVGGHVDFRIDVLEGLGSFLDEIRVLGTFTEERVAWLGDVPTVNEVLRARYGFEIENMPGSLRWVGAHRACKENYPDRWEKLVSTYRQMFDDPEFQAWSDQAAIGRDWVGPEEATRRVKHQDEIFARYAHLLR